MLQTNEPRITVPSQAVLDAALRNAREERAEALHNVSRALFRSVAALWRRNAPSGGQRATAGCS